MNQDTKENIILIGFMGSGKTTISKELAACLHYSWIDMDDMIENEEQTSIGRLFAVEGEAYFRNLETKVLRRLQSFQNQVIATGGGVIASAENRGLLKNTMCIYLEWDFNTLYHRIANDSNRPMVSSYGGLEDLFNKRIQYYEECAKYKIACEGKTVLEITKEIQEIWSDENENSGY